MEKRESVETLVSPEIHEIKPFRNLPAGGLFDYSIAKPCETEQSRLRYSRRVSGLRVLQNLQPALIERLKLNKKMEDKKMSSCPPFSCSEVSKSDSQRASSATRTRNANRRKTNDRYRAFRL